MQGLHGFSTGSLWDNLCPLVQVEGILGGWRELVVTSSSVLPRPLVRALLTAGSKAVICRDPGAPEPLAEAAASFFCALCSAMVGGRALVTALALAGGDRDWHERWKLVIALWYVRAAGCCLA